jgi:peptidoglycan/LPS O-acetylase OafA/YrhL
MLDAWRGVACLMVVVHHAGYAIDWSEADGTGSATWVRWLVVYAVCRMRLGVSLFFVISGYCIAASVDASRRRGGSPWEFLTRRFWRIYPPYWAALLGFALVTSSLDAAGLDRLHRGPHALVLDSPRMLEPVHWLGNLTLTETWRPHLFGPGRNIYTAVAWSLCFEEQFYCLCFIALLVAPRRTVAALAGLTAVLAAVRVGAWACDGLPRLRGTFPLLWHEFAVGLAVYYRLNLARGRVERALIDAGLLALLAAGLLAGGRETATAAGFGLVLMALRRWDARAEDLAWLGPLRACGRRCYSIYLAHLPVCVVGALGLVELGVTGFWGRALVVVPLVSALAVAASFGFFALVESRFLGPPPPRPRFSGRSPVRRPAWHVRLAGGRA